MQVSRLMTKTLITVGPLDSVEEAVKLLRKRGVRHLLVVDRGGLVGIVSDRDLKRALDPAKTKKRLMSVGGLYFLLEPILVEEIMTPDPVVTKSSTDAREAARVMLAHRFGALPVVRGKKPVGIVTETDLLRYFASEANGQPLVGQDVTGQAATGQDGDANLTPSAGRPQRRRKTASKRAAKSATKKANKKTSRKTRH